MLDGRGNVWVTDFGLAQFQTDARLTLTGDLVGTLRYMSPEQTLGGRTLTDHRTDVYSLGATLYELLALQPAFPGDDQHALLRQIATEEPQRLRKLNEGIPAELETIVLKAMQKVPADRYATAQELADDLRRFLNDEPIRARRPPWRQVAVKWARRHRLAVGAAMCVLLTLTVLAGTAGWVMLWVQRQEAKEAQEAERVRQEVGAEIAQAVRFRQAAHFDESREVLEQAQQRLGPDGPADLLEQVEQALADTALVHWLDGARELQYPITEDAPAVLHPEATAQEYAAAFRAAGLGAPGEPAETVAARVLASAVRATLVNALDHWATITADEPQREWLLAVARAADPDPGRNRLRQSALWRDPAALIELAKAPDRVASSPQLAQAVAGRVGVAAGVDLAVLRAAQARFPNDFWLDMDLAYALGRAGRWVESIAFRRAALAVRPESALAHSMLGMALYETRQFDEAVQHDKQAIRLSPRLPGFHVNLGNSLRKQGRQREAVAQYEKALAMDPSFALAHYNLGVELAAEKKLAPAIEHYKRAVELDPKNAKAHNNLGTALDAAERLDEAIAEWQKALALDSTSAWTHFNLGVAWEKKQMLGRAIASFQEAVRLDPSLAEAHFRLGRNLQARRQLDEAITEYEKTLRLVPEHPYALTKQPGQRPVQAGAVRRGGAPVCRSDPH
jgi:serine/threonine-protein kinase